MGINRWEKAQLKTLCNRIGDGLHGTPEYCNNSDIFFINGNNLVDGKIIISKDTKEVPDFEWQDNFIELNKNSLLLSINGTIGEMAFYNDEKIMLGKSVAYLNFKTGINIFYYYYFQLKNIQKYFYQNATGSTIKNLGLKSIQEFEVPYPNLKSWEPIANLLSDIDKKIEINNQIILELETMAKLIYDYWFVQFDFPDENGKPYKSSGGKMVYNEALKREIPDLWSEVKLKDIITRSATGLNPRNNFSLGEGENYYITIKSIENGRIIFDDRCDRVSDESLEIIDKRSNLQVGDVLFTSIQPVGVTYLIQEKPANWNINESVFTIRADSERVTSEFLYMMLSSSEIRAFTKQSSTGSIHKGIRHGVLKAFNLPYGGKGITKSFSEVVSPMLLKSFLLDNENQQLRQLRDWILPMLMNGQVKI